MSGGAFPKAPPFVWLGTASRLCRWMDMPSTAIRRIAYRSEQSALDIQFVTGRVYRYFAVPQEVAEGFRRVQSKGGYFNRALRDRFEFVRLAAWDDADEPALG